MKLLDDLVPDDVRNGMVAHIWRGAQADIQLAITTAMIHELHLEIRSRVCRRIQAELDSVLGPAVEARLGELKEIAERVVKQLFDHVDEEALARLEVAMTFHLDTLFDRISRELANGLRQTFGDAIKQGVEGCRQRRPQPIPSTGGAP